MADQNITLGGVPQSDGLEEADFEELRANFRGELLRSRDDRYDAGRAVFNAFSARLRDEVGLDHRAEELVTVVERSVQPALACGCARWLGYGERKGEATCEIILG